MPCEKRLASCDQKPLILHVYKDRCSYQDITLWFLNAFCFLSVHISQELRLLLDYLTILIIIAHNVLKNVLTQTVLCVEVTFVKLGAAR